MPKRRIFLNTWMPFSASTIYPMLSNNLKLNSPTFPILVHADIQNFNSSNDIDKLQITDLGIPVAWTVENEFSIVLKTDLDNFAKLVSCFLSNSMAINDGMEVLQIETIDLDGELRAVDNESVFKKLIWPYPVTSHRQWYKFVEDLKNICQKNTQLSSSKNGNIPSKVCDELSSDSKSIIPIVISEVNNSTNTCILTKKSENHVEHTSNRKTKTSELKPDKKVHKRHSDKANCSAEKSKDSRDRRSVSKEKEKIKHSSSLDRFKHKEHTDKHKNKESRDTSHKTRREKFVKKHSRENVLDATVSEEKERKEKSDKLVKTMADTSVVRKNFIKAKPPNVLVYADGLETRENVKTVLNEVLNQNRYTIYELPPSGPPHFTDNSMLVVVCGNVNPTLTSHLLHYLLNGGNLLCLCSDFLNSVLHTFTTAEVREHELVRFSYGEWKRVRMMHHIFCYQASPAKKHFSQDSDPNSSNHSSGNSPVAPRTPSTVELHHNNKTYTVQVRVLGQEETWQTPSILLATVKGATGKAVFSQVHLEIDPTQYQGDENKYSALQESNSARLEILRDILSVHLDMDCTSEQKTTDEYKPAYFLGNHELKLTLLSDLSGLVDNKLMLSKLTLQFCGKGVEPPVASSNLLPVLIHSCPENFSTVEYFENLKTEFLGRLVIYSDVMTSSMDVLDTKKFDHGFVVLPARQTAGSGRGGNAWLSPIGCAMFSMQIHVPMNSILAQGLPLIQHLVSVAIVSGIRSQPGYEDIELRLKWPNDIYAYASIKIGGIILNSSVESDLAVCNIGSGTNLSNSLPTTCINDIIIKHNQLKGTALKTLSFEKYLALVFTEMERIYDIIQAGNIEYFYNLYYKYWLHSGAEITVQTSDGATRDVTVSGIDQYGYLTVTSKDGITSSVEPDGNTFDMMEGLIAPKIR
ncbi:Holocarboxylase synthetase [Carabus blaptoides fortunei]